MVTEDAVPVVQRFVVGAVVKDWLLEDPQEPESGEEAGGTGAGVGGACGGRGVGDGVGSGVGTGVGTGVGSGLGRGKGVGSGDGLEQTLVNLAREREPRIPFPLVSPRGVRISPLYFS